MSPTARALAAVPALALAATTCACAGSAAPAAKPSASAASASPAPKQLFPGQTTDKVAHAALAALRDTGSVQVVGDESVAAGERFSDGSTAKADGSLSFDVTTIKSGDCSGMVTEDGSGPIEAVRVANETWIKADQAATLQTLHFSADLAAQAAGTYVLLPKDHPLSEALRRSCGMVAGAEPLLAAGKLTAGPSVYVDDRLTMPISDSSGQTIFVAASPTPQVAMVSPMKVWYGAPEGIAFKQYGGPVTISRPPADQVTPVDWTRG